METCVVGKVLKQSLRTWSTVNMEVESCHGKVVVRPLLERYLLTRKRPKTCHGLLSSERKQKERKSIG